ncbi:Transcription factor TFIIIB component B [Tulasnella sp. 424]|nr:Transcription factor TFIIIB component B [Tulasnella sp. 424]KAG8978628.1 Transcription factor TFIIIB component B [Tulasnella sp. 425]
MYTSSRVEKGGSQYKPIVKPRQQRASATHSAQADQTSQIPRTDESYDSAPRLSPETRFLEPFPPSYVEPHDQIPESSLSGARNGPSGSSSISSTSSTIDRRTSPRASSLSGAHGDSPSTSPTIRPSLTDGWTNAQPGPSASKPTPIVPSRATSIVPTRGTAVAPTTGQSVSTSIGGTAIIPTRGTSIVPTRGGTNGLPSHNNENGAQSSPRGIAITPSRGAPIVLTRGTSIVPNRGMTVATTGTAISIVPTRATSIIPTRVNDATSSGRPSAVAPASTSGNNHHPGFATSPQVVRPTPSSSENEPIAGPSRPSQPAAELAASVSSRRGDLPSSTGSGSSEVPTPDKPKSRPRPRTKPTSKAKSKAKATETGAEGGVEGDGQQELQTRPQREQAKRKRAEEAGGNDDTVQSSASEHEDGDYEAPVEQPQKVKKKREKRASTRKRKPKSSPATLEAGDEAEEDETSERTHAPPRRFQKRQKRLTAFDLVPEDQIPVDEEGQPMIVDPDAITMAELCMDLGVGRPSSRTEDSIGKSLEWKARQKILRLQARERQKAKYSIIAARADGIDGDGELGVGAEREVAGELGEDDEQGVGAAARRLQDAETNTDAAHLPTDPGPQNEGENGQDLSGLRTNRHAVQVRLDENGEVVMDELSLTVDRYEAARAEAPEDSYELVEEAERDRFVNSLTWSKKLTGSRWTKEETDLFYYYHGMWGTDFEMIAHLMPGRTRREIRNKYNTESRKNPARVDQAFARKIPIDLDELSKATGLDFSGPIPEYGPPAASLEKDGDGDMGNDDSQLQVSAPPDYDDDADLPDLAMEGFGRRPTSEVDESGRAGSPISATSGISSAGGKKGKGNNKVKQAKPGKKGKKKGQVLADDEEVIGTVEGF